MDEARAVIKRLERIKALEREPAGDPNALLAELRALVDEAERWARREHDPAAEAAVARCREALEPANLNEPLTRSLLA
jgi:DnaJ-domain-containing protein 1